MSHTVSVANIEKKFLAEDGETLLDTLLRNGVMVRYGCRRGKCATCKHYVNDGDYDNSNASAYALLDDEREEGLTLLCQTYPLSDCVVELREDEAGDAGIRPATPKTTAGTVRRVLPLAGSLWSLQLDLVSPLHALPGQYVELALPSAAAESTSRTFSIASSPLDVRSLEVIVRRYPDGVFSGALETLQPGREVGVSGPYGQVFLRPGKRPLVLVGDEAGIGPLLSIVRYTKAQGWPAPIRLLHIAPTEEELAYRDELGEWDDSKAAFTYYPTGQLGSAVANQIQGDDVDVYVAGAPDFCDQAVFLLEARGVNSSQIYVERFFAAQ